MNRHTCFSADFLNGVRDFIINPVKNLNILPAKYASAQGENMPFSIPDIRLIISNNVEH
jgi:hypothetical protein